MLRRILIVTNRVPYPLRDGGALAMDAMIRGYHHAGTEVALLAMNTSRHPVAEDVLKRLYPQLARFDWVNVDNKIRPLQVVTNFLVSRLPEHIQRFASPEFAEKLTGLLQSFQPDAVQLESLFLTQYLPVIHARSTAVTILRLHNVEHEIWQRLAAESSALKSIYLNNLAARMKRYEQTIWQQYDLLLPITETDAITVRRHTTKPLLTAPFGISVDSFKPVIPKEFKTGYHIGGMDWRPNIAAIQWFISEVWPAVHLAAPEFTFHFAGRSMPEFLKQDLPQQIYCEGEVADAEAFIRDKDMLIVPLRSGGGIRVKILEGMAAGKLVISTAVGMQGIEAENGIHYLQADTPEAFAAAVKTATTNPAKAASIAECGRLLSVSKYAQTEIMNRIVARISALLEK